MPQMHSSGVLVLGHSAESRNTGLNADERAVAAQEVPVVSVSTASSRNDAAERPEIVAVMPPVLKQEIDHAAQNLDCKVIKIGALFSEESIQVVAGLLRQCSSTMSVVDVEPFFKAGSTPAPETVSAFRKHILPSATLISSTVQEAKILLDDAGIAVEYPKSMEDVQAMAEALRRLGPQYAMIKREILNESGTKSMLHFVLCGGPEPQLSSTLWENPKAFFGVSYSIPSAISALLTKGYNVPEAVSGGFAFVGEMLKGGDYFESV